MVVKGAGMRSEIEIEAGLDEGWDALATEEGRSEWLGEDEREIRVESAVPPPRLGWWWWEGSGAGTRGEGLVLPAVSKARVVVIESSPVVPLAMLSARFAMVAA